MSDTVLTRRRLTTLTVAALGVVYGDIGTSPLYALRECFHGRHAVPLTPGNVLGVLSMIIWALILVISLKYLVFVLRAHNKGEGGILALLSLAFPERKGRAKLSKAAHLVVLLGVFGSTLLYGDGIITPAVSILGAVEGLEVATPNLKPFIVPITIVILVALFAAQSAGTGKVGRLFGRVTMLWFIAIAILGIKGILLDPSVLTAVNPIHAVRYFVTNGWSGFVVLASIVLVVTGGEALYADMGHFGARPIRAAWFKVVLPALILNYLGQGALLLHNPEARTSPFYQLCPGWALLPMVVLATAAAIIASQALISGAFSLTWQAIQLGYMPRLVVEHTSADERGQIYMPQVNWALMVACIGLVLGFRSSSNLAAAYGVAVTVTMGVTTILFFFAAQRLWGWKWWQAAAVCAIPLVIETAFSVANLLKVQDGGWFPLVLAAGIFVLMSTWKTGRTLLWKRVRDASMPADNFITDITSKPRDRVPGTAVYMAGNSDGTPIALLHNLKHNKVLHKRIVFLTVITEEDPRIEPSQRIEVEKLDGGFWRVKLHYGFMEEPDVMAALAECSDHGLEFRAQETTFFVSRETIIPSRKSGMAAWREKLFAIMARNASSATAFFRLPPNRVVELGMQVEI